MPRTKKAARKAKSQQRIRRTKEEWEAMQRDNPDMAKSQSYQLAPKSCEMFEKFYSGIGIVPEDEWDTFMETMRQPLPTTFRVTGSRSQAQELLKIIKGQYFSKFIARDDGSPKVEPKSLPWYPDELAWQLDFTKKQIKNDNTLKSLHGFLISETESGNISRQEAVSMLPPLLMDIEPHHKILDMCAAPGSKTAQLIEMLHSDENVPVPDGFVVANDMDNKRCYLMTHQVKRIQSPNCIIINHDARILPNLVTSKDPNAEFVKYDRILCDVPCSGDGTMRKNPDIWKKWHVNGGYNLHRIQKKVLQRGLELLAVGGRLVYSTCSLNPIEDEAVILTLIKQCAGAVELVDVSDRLTGLKYSKGTYSWKMMTKKGVWYETVEQTPPQLQGHWDSTVYPPIITEAQEAKLERCVRVLPHQQNTGAFFIAVLHKTQELPWVSARSRNLGPVINPRLRQDEGESKLAGSEDFMFSVKSRTGMYYYAKCLLCDKTLQGKNDYEGHRNGKKHKQKLILKEELTGKPSTEDLSTQTTSSTESQVPVAMETDSKMSESQTSSDTTSVDTNNTSCSNSDSQTTDNSKSEEKMSDKVETEDKNDSEKNTNGSDLATSSAEVATSVLNVQTENGSESPPAKKMKVMEEVKVKEDSEVRVVIQGHREDPFIFCSKDDPVWPAIKSFYDIDESFGVEQIMYRNMKRILYYVSKPVRNLVICNDERVKFINLGVKCFSNAPSPLVPDCDFRLSQEGLLAIQRHVKGRRVTLTKQDVITILSSENPFICKLSPPAQEYVYAMDPGSALFHFQPNESDPEPNVDIVFCGWRGKTSVRSFVAKDERSHYLRMCGIELTDIQCKVQEMKAVKATVSSATGGTETPVGVSSGDEAELAQWNDGEEAPRATECVEMDDDDDEQSTQTGGQCETEDGDNVNAGGDNAKEDNITDKKDGEEQTETEESKTQE